MAWRKSVLTAIRIILDTNEMKLTRLFEHLELFEFATYYACQLLFLWGIMLIWAIWFKRVVSGHVKTASLSFTDTCEVVETDIPSDYYYQLT